MVQLSAIIPAVLSAQTMARQSDIQAFSFDLRPCEHALLLQQLPNTLSPQDSSARLKHCSSCDLTANLWLCLECGNVACGRKQFGGEGLPGNGHALQHYNETKHPVAVKLGSITAEGKADVYCYEHDEEIVDPDLARHLGNWSIALDEVVVTEKSLAEMQLDLQYKYSFNMSTSSGEPLQPVFGPGLTGLQNLGNSCYVSSVIQVHPRRPPQISLSPMLNSDLRLGIIRYPRMAKTILYGL
jgi:ubiquitin carboxyl-terminal hydrolase 5/13